MRARIHTSRAASTRACRCGSIDGTGGKSGLGRMRAGCRHRGVRSKCNAASPTPRYSTPRAARADPLARHQGVRAVGGAHAANHGPARVALERDRQGHVAIAAASTPRLAVNQGSPPGAYPAILVTRQLAEEAHLRVGDIVSLSTDPSGTAPRPFRIAGLYEPMPDPMRHVSKRREVRLHLPDLLALTHDPQDPLSSESVTAINLALRDPADAG